VHFLINIILFSEPYKKCEVQTMSKLERLVKQSEQGKETSGMGDAVAKTENIRNWVSINFLIQEVLLRDTPK